MSERALSSLAEVVYGRSPNAVRSSHAGYPMYGTGGVVGYSSVPLFDREAVIVPRKGSLGNPQFAEAGFWAIDTTFVALPKEDVDAKWLYYQLAAFDLTKLNEATGVPSINRDWLLEQKFQTPSLTQQCRIATILSALDEQIEKTVAEKVKLDQLILGALDDALGAGLSSPLSRSAIKTGGLTKGWSRITIAQATQEILDFRGRTPLKLGMQWGNGEIPALSANNVEMGRVNFEKESYFGSDALYAKWMTRGDCAKDDVLMTLEAPLGNVSLVPDERKYILSQRVVLLKPNTDYFDGRYLYLYLRWRWFQQLLEEESTGTTAAGIQRKKLERLPVLVAPEPLRSKITGFLMGLLEQQATLETELRKLRLEKQGLMSDLLTGKVRVPS